MKRLLIALLLLGFASDPALPQPDEAAAEAAAGPAAQPEEKADDEIVVEGEVPEKQRRVCVRETPTGSIVSRRVCRTVGEIEEEQRKSQQTLDTFTRERDTRQHTEMSQDQGT